MKPRTAHLIILALLCLGPAGFGVFMIVVGATSHSEFAALALLQGAAFMGGSLLYALISSLGVRWFGTTAGRVLAVHGSILGLPLVLGVGARLFAMVSS